MDLKKYIVSGILELYVAGALSDKENQRVYDAMRKYPEVREEIEKIEAAILKLTAATSPGLREGLFNKIKKEIIDIPKVLDDSRIIQEFLSRNQSAEVVVMQVLVKYPSKIMQFLKR